MKLGMKVSYLDKIRVYYATHSWMW